MRENPFRGNPEGKLQAAQALDAKPFEIMTNQVDEKRVLALMTDKELMKSLLAASWPTDEETCDKIGVEQGLGAEFVAAVSKYQRGILAEQKDIRNVH